MSRPRTELLLASLADPDQGRARELDLGLLVLAAHPDDETIGSSLVLGRLPGSVVVYLTDGAPRNPSLRSPLVQGSRELYAAVRAEEAASALAHVHIGQQQILFLTGIDQEAIFRVSDLVEELVGIVQEFKPAILVTHAYEGGHPDHDTAALVARLTVEVVARQNLAWPEVMEMTSYHAEEGKRVTGKFLASPPLVGQDAQSSFQLNMSSVERERKAEMLACYVSQSDVLSGIALEPEQLRPSPLYDFTRPPHSGTLWYETLGWPLTGSLWRELAGQVLAQFGELACR